MPLTTKEVLETLKAQKPYLAERFGVIKLALFGSYARGDFNTESDIDLLVELKQKDFKMRFYLREYLESIFKRKVDVAYFDSVRPFAKQFVEKDIIHA